MFPLNLSAPSSLCRTVCSPLECAIFFSLVWDAQCLNQRDVLVKNQWRHFLWFSPMKETLMLLVAVLKYCSQHFFLPVWGRPWAQWVLWVYARLICMWELGGEMWESHKMTLFAFCVSFLISFFFQSGPANGTKSNQMRHPGFVSIVSATRDDSLSQTAKQLQQLTH